MIFTSIHFWAFFIVFLTIFALLRRTTRTGMMLYVTIISLALFFYTNHWLMQLLPLTALISWSLTKVMKQYDGTKRKVFLTSIILLDLTPLAYFKYSFDEKSRYVAGALADSQAATDAHGKEQ